MEILLQSIAIIVLLGAGCYAVTLAQRSYEDRLYEKFKKKLEEESRE